MQTRARRRTKSLPEDDETYMLRTRERGQGGRRGREGGRVVATRRAERGKGRGRGKANGKAMG